LHAFEYGYDYDYTMTTEPVDVTAAEDAHAHAHAHAKAEHLAQAAAGKEAYQYWGYLIKEDKCGTDKLDRLLRGLGGVIVSSIKRSDYLGG
jgi:hypothetical protein